MSQIISIHSFSRGVGKSSLIANVAALLARDGRSVGLVDANFTQPSLPVLFGVDDRAIQRTLNDFAMQRCDIAEAAYDITPTLGPGARGRLMLVPSSTHPGAIVSMLREGYRADLLNAGFEQLIRQASLDVLMVDAHAGINEDVLISIAISDVLAVVLRLDKQNYQGTGVLIEVARRLQIPRVTLIVNQVAGGLDPDLVKAQVETAYKCTVAAVLPHSEELMTAASASVFAIQYPDHPMTARLRQIAAQLAG